MIYWVFFEFLSSVGTNHDLIVYWGFLICLFVHLSRDSRIHVRKQMRNSVQNAKMNDFSNAKKCERRARILAENPRCQWVRKKCGFFRLYCGKPHLCLVRKSADVKTERHLLVSERKWGSRPLFPLQLKNAILEHITDLPFCSACVDTREESQTEKV